MNTFIFARIYNVSPIRLFVEYEILMQLLIISKVLRYAFHNIKNNQNIIICNQKL